MMFPLLAVFGCTDNPAAHQTQVALYNGIVTVNGVAVPREKDCARVACNTLTAAVVETLPLVKPEGAGGITTSMSTVGIDPNVVHWPVIITVPDGTRWRDTFDIAYQCILAGSYVQHVEVDASIQTSSGARFLVVSDMAPARIHLSLTVKDDRITGAAGFSSRDGFETRSKECREHVFADPSLYFRCIESAKPQWRTLQLQQARPCAFSDPSPEALAESLRRFGAVDEIASPWLLAAVEDYPTGDVLRIAEVVFPSKTAWFGLAGEEVECVPSDVQTFEDVLTEYDKFQDVGIDSEGPP